MNKTTHKSQSDLDVFITLYEEAKLQNKELFTFKDKSVLVKYAAYLIEYAKEWEKKGKTIEICPLL